MIQNSFARAICDEEQHIEHDRPLILYATAEVRLFKGYRPVVCLIPCVSDTLNQDDRQTTVHPVIYLRGSSFISLLRLRLPHIDSLSFRPSHSLSVN